MFGRLGRPPPTAGAAPLRLGVAGTLAVDGSTCAGGARLSPGTGRSSGCTRSASRISGSALPRPGNANTVRSTFGTAPSVRRTTAPADVDTIVLPARAVTQRAAGATAVPAMHERTDP